MCLKYSVKLTSVIIDNSSVSVIASLFEPEYKVLWNIVMRCYVLSITEKMEIYNEKTEL